MKIALFIVTAFLYSYSGFSQNIAMQTITNNHCRINAQIPAFYTTHVDTLGLEMYSSLTSDSLIGAQLFIYNNYSLDSNEVLKEYMQTYNETDTLKTIAKFMVSAAEGTLVYFQVAENTPSNKSFDIGIRYPDMNTSFISFTRIVIRSKQMVILNVYSQECYLSQLINARDTCYAGLYCY